MSQASIPLQSTTFTPAQVIAVYQAELDALTAVANAKTALSAAVAKAKSVRTTTTSFDKAFTSYVEGVYAGAPTTLADFGIVVTVRKAVSALVKTAASVKAKATRALRHTMGSAQKAAIKPVTMTVSVVATPSPAAAASPVAAVAPVAAPALATSAIASKG